MAGPISASSFAVWLSSALESFDHFFTTFVCLILLTQLDSSSLDAGYFTTGCNQTTAANETSVDCKSQANSIAQVYSISEGSENSY